jgi:hypothetical protein
MLGKLQMHKFCILTVKLHQTNAKAKSNGSECVPDYISTLSKLSYVNKNCVKYTFVCEGDTSTAFDSVVSSTLS